jgi:hypothetical protein
MSVNEGNVSADRRGARSGGFRSRPSSRGERTARETWRSLLVVKRLVLPHLAVFAVAIVGLRVAVVPAEVCPAVDAVTARAAIAEAATWFERGLRPGGRFTYGYHHEHDRISHDYNITRHAGVMMSLYRLGDREAVAGADHGLPLVLANLVRHDDWSAFAEPGQEARLGATALATAALVHRRLATGDRAHDDLIRRLARFLVAQQLPDGRVLGFWSPATGRPVPDRYSKFGTGEALWALALVHRLFPDEGWDVPARRLARYIATGRDDVEGYVLTFPDHWAAYGLAELDALRDVEADYARRLAASFGLMSRVESQSGPSGIRRLFRGEPASGAGLGTIGEGLGALWRLSRTDPRLSDLADDLELRLRCTAGRTVARQADDGAWYSPDGYTQMDDQQHAISALQAALPMLEAP